VKWEDFSKAIELYCNTLLKKLEKEERELFSMARREIPQGEWFSIAEKFLLHDAEIKEHERQHHSRILPQSIAPKAISQQTVPCRALSRPKVLSIARQDNSAGGAVLSYVGMDATSRMVSARL
jgi:hypothetical protein